MKYDGETILDALGVHDLEDVTRAVLVIRAAHIPTLHVWRHILNVDGAAREVSIVRDDYELVARGAR